MKHKDISKAWGEILNWLDYYRVPYYCKKGEGDVYALGSKIKVAGCYVTNSTQIAFIEINGLYRYSHAIIVLEEGFEFDEKTEAAIKEAIRGAKYQTWIYRSNPWLLSNWYISRCFSTVPFLFY